MMQGSNIRNMVPPLNWSRVRPKTGLGERDRAGFYSIRVNDQWRVVFRWESNNAQEVRLMVYHD